MKRVNQSKNWIVEKKQRLLKIDFVRFVIAGSVGFVLTAITLEILHATLGIKIFLATLISSEVGLLSNFFFHENWTYNHIDHRHTPKIKKLVRFHMSSWSGVAILTIVETFLVRNLKVNYLISLVIGTGITLFWNFFWTKYFIFKNRSPKVLLDIEQTVVDSSEK